MTKSGRVKTMKLIHTSGSVRCNNVTISSYWGCTWPTYGENLMTIITDANKEAILSPAEDLKAFKARLITKNTFTVFLDITITQLSSFFATSSIHCLSRATKRCRYGTDRIGWTAERKTTAVKLVLMCTHGMSEFANWRSCLRQL